MKIGFFGNIGERLGREIEHFPPQGVTTVADLRCSLATIFPDVAAELTGKRLKAVIDDAMVAEDTPLSGVDRVEFFPPVSGG